MKGQNKQQPLFFLRGIVFKGKMSYHVDLNLQGVEGLIIPVLLFKKSCMECELAQNFSCFNLNYVHRVCVLFLLLNLFSIRLIF